MGFFTAAEERAAEVYGEQFVAGWQSTPARFTFLREAQREEAAAGSQVTAGIKHQSHNPHQKKRRSPVEKFQKEKLCGWCSES